MKMKTKRVVLMSWSRDSEVIDIDWPQAQRLLGLDCLRWINGLAPVDCQMIVEKSLAQQTLVIEFYNDAVYQEYITKYHYDRACYQ